MSRRSCKIVKTLTQRGVPLADAKATARNVAQRKPWRMVDGVTGKQVATLSVRKSRAMKRAKWFGGEARLVKETAMSSGGTRVEWDTVKP